MVGSLSLKTLIGFFIAFCCFCDSSFAICTPDSFFPATTSLNTSFNPFLTPGIQTGLQLCPPNDLSFFQFQPSQSGVLELTLTWPQAFFTVDVDLTVRETDNTFLAGSFAFQEVAGDLTLERLTFPVVANHVYIFKLELFSTAALDDPNTYTLNITLDTSRLTTCFTDNFSGTGNLVVPPNFFNYAQIQLTDNLNNISVCDGNGRGFQVSLPQSSFGFVISAEYFSRGNIFRAQIFTYDNANIELDNTLQTDTSNPEKLLIPPAQTNALLNFVIYDIRSWDGTVNLKITENLPAPVTTSANTGNSGSNQVVNNPGSSNTVAIAVSVSIVAVVVLVVLALIAVFLLRKKTLVIVDHNTAQNIRNSGIPQNPENPYRSANPTAVEPKLVVTTPTDIVDPSVVAAPTKKLQRFEVDYRELEGMTPIGKGSFGVVFKAKWRETEVAVKQLNSNLLSDEKAIADFRGEAEILCSLRPHPNVILFLGITAPPQPVTILTEYCGNGSLYRLLKSDVKLPVELQYKILGGIARGMHHLHSENIIHRDLAARNILLTDSFDVKVSDFGMSRQKHTEEDAQKTKSDVGPLKWMAPEAIEKKIYSFASDVYSYAITMWEVLSRDEPYPNLDSVASAMKVVYENLRPEIPSSAESHLVEIMKKCWSKEPEKRPSFKEICGQIHTSSKDLGIANVVSDGFSVQNGSAGPSGGHVPVVQEANYVTTASVISGEKSIETNNNVSPAPYGQTTSVKVTPQPEDQPTLYSKMENNELKKSDNSGQLYGKSPMAQSGPTVVSDDVIVLQAQTQPTLPEPGNYDKMPSSE